MGNKPGQPEAGGVGKGHGASASASAAPPAQQQAAAASKPAVSQQAQAQAAPAAQPAPAAPAAAAPTTVPAPAGVAMHPGTAGGAAPLAACALPLAAQQPAGAGAGAAPAPHSNNAAIAAAPMPAPSDSSSSGGGGIACCSGPSSDAADGSSRRRHGANLGSGLTPDDFELLKVVGKGSFGKVFQVAKKDTGAVYAMKVLKKEQLLKRKQVAHTQTERRVLEEIDHPFIVSLRFAFQTADKLYLVLDYFTGGELFFHLKANGRFSEELARFYAAEITLALECLHAHTIVYRDLKPENVLLDEEGHIRLTDFGLSKESITGNTLTHTFCGTPEYLAPEVIHGAGYNKAVDWWSLGTLLFEMLTGLPPFFHSNVHVMYEKIMRATLTFPPHVSPQAQSLLTGLLQRNPAQRLGGGARDAAELKEHPFFAGLDWKALAAKRVTPPFRPFTKDGAVDTSNVDEEFKREQPKDTPVAPSALRARVNFPDFSYAAPDAQQQQQQDALQQEAEL